MSVGDLWREVVVISLPVPKADDGVDERVVLVQGKGEEFKDRLALGRANTSEGGVAASFLGNALLPVTRGFSSKAKSLVTGDARGRSQHTHKSMAKNLSAYIIYK